MSMALSFVRAAWDPLPGMLEPTVTAELVRRALEGDTRAFDGLARAFLRPAYAVALAVLGRPADAEDVAQEAVAAALERIDACRDPERFGAWLLQGVRNRARNAAAHRRLADVPPDEAGAGDGSGPGGDGEVAVLRRQLMAAIQNITPLQREVILLHDLEGWTHAEIGNALEISEVSSRQHLFNARRALRVRLGVTSPAKETK